MCPHQARVLGTCTISGLFFVHLARHIFIKLANDDFGGAGDRKEGFFRCIKYSATVPELPSVVVPLLGGSVMQINY